ncbi:hypothetical protein BH11PLA2_BH11PLA2_44020 [soil metagenome]
MNKLEVRQMTLTLSRDAEKGSAVRVMAKRFGVSEDTLRNWINDGVVTEGGRVRLRAVRVAGSYRITDEAVEQFLQAQNITSILV